MRRRPEGNIKSLSNDFGHELRAAFLYSNERHLSWKLMLGLKKEFQSKISDVRVKSYSHASRV